LTLAETLARLDSSHLADVSSAVSPEPAPIRAKDPAGLQIAPIDLNSGIDIDIVDLSDLLSAMTARLVTLSGDGPLACRAAVHRMTVAQIQENIRDCACAMDQLHRAFLHELAKNYQLKLDVVTAQATMARQHVELIGTRAQERRARHMARHDALTLLPNSDYFTQRLTQALDAYYVAANPVGLAVFFLDLDGFKQVNDTYGHAVGDEVLKIVATRLRQAVRADDVVGRLGGDEFACLLADFPSRAQIANQASKLFDKVGEPMWIGELRLVIQPSIGIAVCPDDGLTADALLKQADAAMYQTKRSQSGFAFLS
jgi:diguanylate cyclase